MNTNTRTTEREALEGAIEALLSAAGEGDRIGWIPHGNEVARRTCRMAAHALATLPPEPVGTGEAVERLTAERDALAKRVEALEAQLTDAQTTLRAIVPFIPDEALAKVRQHIDHIAALSNQSEGA